MKINYEQAKYISAFKQPHWFQAHCCDWEIWLENQNSGYISCSVKWWVHLLLFVPAIIANLFLCIWDGGIKSFTSTTLSRNISCYCITGLTSDGENTMFGRLKKVYNGQ